MNKQNWNNAFPDAPQNFKDKVRLTLNSLPDKKEIGEMENKNKYTKGSFKKKFVVAMAATFILGTTAFAAGKIFYIGVNSTNIPTYTSLPNENQLNDKVGFVPKIVDKFDNGYVFDKGYTGDVEGVDKDGNTVIKGKDLHFTYEKDNDVLSLFMEDKMYGEKSENEVVAGTYNNIDLYYTDYANKLVPGDYEMTKQDKADEASGKYVFSYGSIDIEVTHIQGLNWEQDGIYYSFSVRDSDLTKDELVKMAHKVIDTK